MSDDTPTPGDDLTDRQRDVLKLHREGKGPTEIGAELDISSQGVSGHLRRLKAKGYIEDDTPAAPKPKAKPKAAKPKADGEQFNPASTIQVVVETITVQLDALARREREINDEMSQLTAELNEIEKARAGLQTLMATTTQDA